MFYNYSYLWASVHTLLHVNWIYIVLLRVAQFLHEPCSKRNVDQQQRQM